jgi:Leishmanolysin
VNLRYLSGSLLILIAVGACKDGPTPPPVAGPPAMIAIHSGNNQSAPANTVLPTAPQVVVRDANGVGVPNQQVTFTVVEGGGSIAGSTTVTTDAQGVATAPPWRLGKSNVPQKLRATHGTWSQEISATIQTNYNIIVRFFGNAMTAAQQALFTTAAERLEGILTGDVQNVQASNIDLEEFCGITGQPPMSEIVDDVIVYAAIDSIDGRNNILAQAGYCVFRQASGGSFPAVGVMMFDEADLDNITQGGSLQDVITHEMLHVLGFGTLWTDKNLLIGAGGPDPRFTGPQARAGCQASGGTVSCATNVPVEGNTAPPGTRDGHWREATFNTELMTGFIDQGTLPISSITIGSLADLGYTVNAADNDPYTIAIGALRANATTASLLQRDGWEKPLDKPKLMIGADGKGTVVPRK